MKKMYLIVAGAVLGGLLVGAPVRAMAQNDPRDQTIGSLQLDQADIRDALKILFRNVGVSYSIDSNVQGTVTCGIGYEATCSVSGRWRPTVSSESNPFAAEEVINHP